MSITKFLSQFYPDPDEPIWLRTFDAKHIPKENRGVPLKIEVSVNVLASDKAVQARLKELNRRQGIYFVVNAGGSADSDITRVNAIFCEMDDRPVIEQHDVYDNESPWSPSLRVETKKSVHAYWLLSEPISTKDFLELQQGLIAFYSSDRSIKNLSRVMRVPFFNHVDYVDGYIYQRVTLHTFNPEFKYSLAELRTGFPYTPPKRVIPTFEQPNGRMETLDDVKAELRARIMATDSWTAHGKWGCANARCHDGEGDTGIRIDLVSGAVTCWSECSLKTILEAYGLEMPKGHKFDYVERKEQRSALWRWYQENKK